MTLATRSRVGHLTYQFVSKASNCSPQSSWVAGCGRLAEPIVPKIYKLSKIFKNCGRHKGSRTTSWEELHVCNFPSQDIFLSLRRF